MHKSILFIICICFSVCFLSAQTEDPSIKFANTITTTELKEHLSILASDAYEGRETGTKGLIMAADYISAQFTKSGIPPIEALNGYYQSYPLIEFGWETSTITGNKKLFGLMQDFYGYATSNNPLTFTGSEILFLGYGIDDSTYSDYTNVDVKGKVILVSGGEPMLNNISQITHSDSVSAWTKDWRKKVAAATAHGVKCIMIIDPNFDKIVSNPQWRNFLEGKLLKLSSEYKQSDYVNNLFISQQMAEQILGKKKKLLSKTLTKINTTFKPVNFTYNTLINFNLVKSERVVFADNVLGYIEGTDLKDELIVVSAHYDHLGMDGNIVYNGADDDGSGTVAVLEIAEAMMQAKLNGEGPRRSILFMTFSGEEKGLFGSKSYTDDPVFPLENTIADLNIDMIGRVDDAHKNDSDYVYIIGSNFLSTELHSINEAAAKTYTNLELDYSYNNTSDPNRYYYRSDHYNFAKNNIPVIFYFNGSHDDYHKPTDDIEKINFDLLAERAKLVFHTLWILANQDARIKVDVLQE